MVTCDPAITTATLRAPSATEHLNIVIVGHVDHGKSTLLGRLYADTGSLPEGKLDKVREICRRQGKEFEYAFLFDAFLEEQEQGITIDTARTFFKWEGRHYIIIDAPGHKEFLKNMVSGAARAEAALLVIDAYEGVKEQSKKHGYLLSLLGIRQVAVVVNKMDLVDYRQDDRGLQRGAGADGSDGRPVHGDHARRADLHPAWRDRLARRLGAVGFYHLPVQSVLDGTPPAGGQQEVLIETGDARGGMRGRRHPPDHRHHRSGRPRGQDQRRPERGGRAYNPLEGAHHVRPL